MFENRGSNLRYRHPMPFEEDNFQITPANLHEYLNMCRPKRTKKYQHSGQGIFHQERALQKNSMGQKKYLSEQKMEGNALNSPKSVNFHSTGFKNDRHTSDGTKLPQRKPIDYISGLNKIKPSSTTGNSRRAGHTSLNNNSKVAIDGQQKNSTFLNQTVGSAQIGINLKSQKNGTILQLGFKNSNSATKATNFEEQKISIFKERKQKTNYSKFQQFQTNKSPVNNYQRFLNQQSQSSLFNHPLPKQPKYPIRNNIHHERLTLNHKKFIGTGYPSPSSVFSEQQQQYSGNILKTTPVREEHAQKQQISNIKKQIKKVFCAADCFKGRRPYNQDRYLCLNNCFYETFRDKLKKTLVNKHEQHSIKNSSNNQQYKIHPQPSQENPANFHKTVLQTIQKSFAREPTSQYEQNSKNNMNRYDLFGVFDGHGGSKCSEYIKDNLYQVLSRNPNLFNDPKLALKQTVHRLQQQFTNSIEKKGCLDVSGSCAVICLIKNQELYVANVGDSRAMIMNQNQCKQITKDHKPDDPGEKMRIIKNGGKLYKDGATIRSAETGVLKIFSQTRVMPGSLNVSRTLGDIQAKMKKYGGAPGIIVCDPEIFTQSTKGYECLLLASDGLFEGLTNEKIHEIYLKWQNDHMTNYNKEVGMTQQTANVLVKELINQAGVKSNDNITVVCVFLQQK